MRQSLEKSRVSAEFVSSDIERLAARLREVLKGEVRFDEGSRALYSTDASNYRYVPIGVVIPRTREDVIETVRLCHDFKIPVLSRGGGTSLAGQCCNTAVVLDMSKYLNHVLKIDPSRRLARVEPGTVLDTLRDAAKPHGLTFGPDPATHSRCTLGGMLGNNSCGVHSIMAGRTADNVEELEVLTYGGEVLTVGRTTDEEYRAILEAGGRKAEIYRRLDRLRSRYADLVRARYPRIPRRVSGYNLNELLPENNFQVARALVGSEGTCVTILSASLKLVDSPGETVLLVLGFEDIAAAADHVLQVREFGPTALEALDHRLVSHMRKKGMREEQLGRFPEGKGWLVVEFGASQKSEAKKKAEHALAGLGKAGIRVDARIMETEEDQKGVWEVRESGLGATAFVPGEKDTWTGWEDSAVHPAKMGSYVRDMRTLLDRYGYDGAFYGHFGDGCLHTRISFDLATEKGAEKFRSFMHEAADTVLKYEGSLSGEHGDGQGRAELLEKMYGPELIEAFREFKRIWDPEWKMNPGKIIDAPGMTENLRLQTPLRMQAEGTFFRFPAEGNLQRVAIRCVGVGKCRRQGGGTMCPSYMVTREEQHSTRGRARLLFEMMAGDVLRNGWKEEAVRDALDLCLACKGCKAECPVNVDMASYKAEFLSHYYEDRARPLRAYAFGWLDRWARLAEIAPWAANFFTQTPGLRDLAKALIGIAPPRSIPKFASHTFTGGFRGGRGASGRGTVILWPDTFNNHFYPEILQAAEEVLTRAGYTVELPPRGLCCGRPLYDFGMLDLARKYLEKIMEALSLQIEARTPIVGLEPSCISVFRDELGNLFPESDAARKLRAQFFTLGEFLDREKIPLPRLERRALVHGHCHHKAVMGFASEGEVMKKMGLKCEILDSGCCGMAGAFGFEKEHYEVSVKAAERVLLPKVKSAGPDQLLIADGFSCREQILQLGGRRASHLAEVLRDAYRAHSEIA